MIVILKWGDLENLKNIFSENLIKDIKEKYVTAWESLGEGNSINEFSLEEHGEIIILERGDDVWNLDIIGLRSLLDCFPEWVELLDLGNDIRTYCLCAVISNEKSVIIYSEPGIHIEDEEVEHWLAEEAGLS